MVGGGKAEFSFFLSFFFHSFSTLSFPLHLALNQANSIFPFFSCLALSYVMLPIYPLLSGYSIHPSTRPLVRPFILPNFICPTCLYSISLEYSLCYCIALHRTSTFLKFMYHKMSFFQTGWSLLLLPLSSSSAGGGGIYNLGFFIIIFSRLCSHHSVLYYTRKKKNGKNRD